MPEKKDIHLKQVNQSEKLANQIDHAASLLARGQSAYASDYLKLVTAEILLHMASRLESIEKSLESLEMVSIDKAQRQAIPQVQEDETYVGNGKMQLSKTMKTGSPLATSLPASG